MLLHYVYACYCTCVCLLLTATHVPIVPIKPIQPHHEFSMWVCILFLINTKKPLISSPCIKSDRAVTCLVKWQTCIHHHGESLFNALKIITFYHTHDHIYDKYVELFSRKSYVRCVCISLLC